MTTHPQHHGGYAPLLCPGCRNNTAISVNTETVLIGCVIDCPYCHRKFIINLANLKITSAQYSKEHTR